MLYSTIRITNDRQLCGICMKKQWSKTHKLKTISEWLPSITNTNRQRETIFIIIYKLIFHIATMFWFSSTYTYAHAQTHTTFKHKQSIELCIFSPNEQNKEKFTCTIWQVSPIPKPIWRDTISLEFIPKLLCLVWWALLVSLMTHFQYIYILTVW